MTDRDIQRDRLIELISQAKNIDGYATPCSVKRDSLLADHLLANGVIVPPCNVGDILFCIFSDKSIDKVYMHIEVCRVTDIKYFASDSFVFGVKEINKHYNHNVVLGENAFKTFEEAEEKLKECS